MNLVFLNHIFILSAIAACAASAILNVSGRNMDTFGAIALGIITAVGGGTVRDVILGVPVFWSEDPSYIWVALIISLITYITIKFFLKKSTRKSLHLSVLYLDGLAASLFAISATKHVWDLKFCLPLGPVMLGMLTAIGGGLLRDVLAGQKTLLMSRELYSVPICLGSVIYLYLLFLFPQHNNIISILCVSLIFIARSSAIYWQISTPNWIEYFVAKFRTHYFRR